LCSKRSFVKLFVSNLFSVLSSSSAEAGTARGYRISHQQSSLGMVADSGQRGGLTAAGGC